MSDHAAVNVIAVLGGNLVKGEYGWRTTFFKEDVPGAGWGDRLRVVAAAHLYSYLSKKIEPVFVLSSGGVGKLRGTGAPPLAEVIHDELVELGVPKEAIVGEADSGTTFEQLKALQDFLKALPADTVRAFIISNMYHLPRIKVMIENLEGLKPILQMYKKFRLDIKSAEEICIDSDKIMWEPIVSEAYGQCEMEERVAKELQGIMDIKKGVYRL